MRRWTILAAAAAVLILGGCATAPADSGFSGVATTARERLGQDLQWARRDADREEIERRVQTLVSKPLTVEDAVQLALVNNRGLQARFHDLGIAAADWTQAGRLPNPGFSFGRLRKGDEVELERGLHVDLVRLLFLPTLSRLAEQRFDQTRREVAMDVIALAAETRKAYYAAVAADETVRYMGQVRQAAQAGAELARRMEQAGNFNKLDRAREQGFHADAALGLARAEQLQRSSRERLTRLLGLWGVQLQFRLPERLPELPTEPVDQPDVERIAMRQRLDVEAARLGVEQLAARLGLSRTTRWIDAFELGGVRNSSNEAPTQRGWEIGFELPLFDWGTARVARAESIYMQAVERAAQAAIEARSEVREAYGNYRSAYDIARHHRDEIVPLKKRISEEQLLRYNGMLIGVFELLADARSQVASVNAYIESVRDFWIAKTDLDMALIGKATLSPPAGPGIPAIEAGGAPH